MSAANPRTRRELREAFESERAGRAHFKKRAEELQALLDKIEPKLEADGWKATRQPGIVVVSMSSDKTTWPPASDWNAPDRAAAEQRVVADAVNGARRGVLTTVINALGIQGYTRTRFPAYSDPEQAVDTERFWADIQTAVQVHEEKRVAAARERTAQTVEKLGCRATLSVDGSIFTEKIQAFAGQAEKISPNGLRQPGSSYGARESDWSTGAMTLSPESIRILAEALSTRLATGAKPAKKKSEDKK